MSKHTPLPLNEYFELQEKIFDYFGYEEDWVIIPLGDYTEYTWYLEGEGRGDSVLFWEKNPYGGNYYAHEIYTQRFLPKWVYYGEKYTMVVSDTHTDGNKVLAVFDNSKRVDYHPEEPHDTP